jgi:hypothetical protein
MACPLSIGQRDRAAVGATSSIAGSLSPSLDHLALRHPRARIARPARADLLPGPLERGNHRVPIASSPTARAISAWVEGPGRLRIGRDQAQRDQQARQEIMRRTHRPRHQPLRRPARRSRSPSCGSKPVRWTQLLEHVHRELEIDQPAGSSLASSGPAGGLCVAISSRIFASRRRGCRAPAARRSARRGRCRAPRRAPRRSEHRPSAGQRHMLPGPGVLALVARNPSSETDSGPCAPEGRSRVSTS